jgi:hypothetical protein
VHLAYETKKNLTVNFIHALEGLSRLGFRIFGRLISNLIIFFFFFWGAVLSEIFIYYDDTNSFFLDLFLVCGTYCIHV